jgi:hypothetical protein
VVAVSIGGGRLVMAVSIGETVLGRWFYLGEAVGAAVCIGTRRSEADFHQTPAKSSEE